MIVGARPFGIAAILARTAERFGDGLALTHDGVTRSWRDVAARVGRQAAIIADRTEPGDRIAILARNGPAFFEASFAIPWAGRIFVPINERLVSVEIERLLNRCHCTLLMFDDAFADMARPLIDGRDIEGVYIGGQGACPNFADDLETASRTISVMPPTTPPRDAVWAVIFTGGTTGEPKGVELTHDAIEYNIETIDHHLDWGTRPKFLHVTPLFHLAGLGPSFAVTLWGGTHHFLPRFVIADFLATMMRHRIDASALVPTMIAWLVAEPDATRAKLPAWKYLGYGASAIQEETLRRLAGCLPDIALTQFYGQTEACGNLTVLAPADHRLDGPHPERLRSAGQPAIGVELRIVRNDGSVCEPNEAGEITGRSRGLFKSYHAYPALSAQALKDGWLHTGDIGYRDEYGYLYVTDRVKDMIVTGGENVASSEVEQVIAAHPAITQCAVIGVPDPEWGERVHAVCVVGDDRRLDHRELARFCADKLAGYKVHKTSDITPEPLPLSALGKVRKDILRERASRDARP